MNTSTNGTNHSNTSPPGVTPSRRNFLTNLLGGGAAAFAFSILPGSTRSALAQSSNGNPSDIDVLNFALTLEHLENVFYREGLRRFRSRDFSNLRSLRGFGSRLTNNVYANLRAIGRHESDHVVTLTQTIRDLGGTPVREARYNFPYNDAQGFLGLAQVFENTGVSAYDGSIALIDSPDLQTAGATIATVEARHASYLNLITGRSPFPASFDTPKSMAEIMAAVAPFIVGQNGNGGGSGGGGKGKGSGSSNGNGNGSSGNGTRATGRRVLPTRGNGS